MGNKCLPLVLLAAMAQLVGCAGTDSVAPTSNAVAGPVSLASAAAPVIETELPLSAVGGSGISGTVTLTRTAEGLWADLAVDGLTPGYAYSIWWGIFDNPQGCVDACDPSDLAVREAQGSLVNGGGFVATGSTVYHQTHLLRHDIEGKSLQVGDASGVDNPFRAEVHVVVRNHGPAETDPANLALQTGTFATFCNLPMVGCANAALSMFSAPGAPGRAE